MSVSLSLSQKVITLMAAALVMELVFVSSLGILQARAEEEAERARHSTRVTDAINVLAREIYSFLAVLNGKRFSQAFFETDTVPRFCESVHEQFQILKAEKKDRPAELKIVLKSEEAAERGLTTLRELETNPISRARLDDMPQRYKIIDSLKSNGRFILSRDFVDLNSREKEIARRSPRKQAAIRKQQITILWVAVVLNILTFMAAAVWLVRSITGRLQIMSDNAFRFAAGRELNPVMMGGDEIAILDYSFHNMADSVRQAARKERAVVEQARDVICSIDAAGKFAAVNPAAEKLLGYEPSEMTGKPYLTFVRDDDIELLGQVVQQAMKEGDVEPLEVRLTGRNGSELDTVWSMHWSGAENSLFCVIHDDSARKQAERLRQDLIAMLTHDLKTPLTYLTIFLELLQEDTLGQINKRGLEMSGMANECVEQMSRMVNDMLDMEKVKAGSLAPAASLVSIGALIDSACGPLAAVAAAAKVRLELNKTDDSACVDPEMITRVIANLVSNAIKFSPENSTITVRAFRNADRIGVSVSDEGCGIPEDLAVSVFDKYVQVPGKKKGGSGLGLAICKAFVELNGGSIRLQSKVNEGTTITFDLPAADTSTN
jgi:PAS domain S-box-containing protein